MSDMYPEERRAAVVEAVRDRGRASVAELAQRFDVTTETVRRDLTQLESAGLLRRVHGGAVLVENVATAEPTVAIRAVTNSDVKAAIGAAAVALLPATGPVTALLDAGSTTVQVAARLTPRPDLRVVTHALAVAAAAGERGVEVRVVGGRLRPVTGAAVGGVTVERYRSLRADVLLLATNGLSLARGCSTPDPEEAAVKAAMVAAAERVVLLADSSKLGVERLVTFAGLDDIDVLVTDQGLPDDQRALLADRGIEVVLA